MRSITYNGYCALGGAANPRLYCSAMYLGKWFMHWDYWLMAY